MTSYFSLPYFEIKLAAVGRKMTSSTGEIITISFGPTANAVTSHLCNLQGLACTASNPETNPPLCDPNVTHDMHDELYVPRVLFVDGNNCYPSFSSPSGRDIDDCIKNAHWDGKVEVHRRSTPLLPVSTTDFHDDTLTRGLSNNYSDQNTVDRSLADLNETAINLSNMPDSRYRASRYSSKVSSRYVYSSASSIESRGRHVIWDEEEDEEGSDEEENRRFKRNKKQNQEIHEQSLHDRMGSAWNIYSENKEVHPLNVDEGTKGISQDTPGIDQRIRPTSADISINQPDLRWADYFMAPRPPISDYSVPLPFDRPLYSRSVEQLNNDSSAFFSHCGGYSPSGSTAIGGMGQVTNKWREEVMSDKIRRSMEKCDFIQGFQVMIDNNMGLFSGLACSALEEIGDECKRAGKLSIMIGDCYKDVSTESGKSQVTERRVIEHLLSQINNGLSLHGVSENSDLVLPLSLKNCKDALFRKNESITNPLLDVKQQGLDDTSQSHTSNKYSSLFETSAAAALALESITLPYCLLESSKKMVIDKRGVKLK